MREKRERLSLPDTISARRYNLIIGGCFLYGTIMSGVMFLAEGDFFYWTIPWMDPIVLTILYLICCAVGVVLTYFKNPLWRFLGYTLVIVPLGVVIDNFPLWYETYCPLYYSEVAFIAASSITVFVLVMSILATIYPRILVKKGRVMFIAFIISVPATVAQWFIFADRIISEYDLLFSVVPSLYMGFVWHKAQKYPKNLSNAIDSVCDLYMNIINPIIWLIRKIGGNKCTG